MKSSILRKSVTLMTDKSERIGFTDKIDLDKTEFTFRSSHVVQECPIHVRFGDDAQNSFESPLILPTDGVVQHIWDTSILDFPPVFTYMEVTAPMDLSLEVIITEGKANFR